MEEEVVKTGRAESSRDRADLSLSLSHLPKVLRAVLRQAVPALPRLQIPPAETRPRGMNN